MHTYIQTYRYTNGDLYEGDFKNDLKDGFGQLKYHSGAIFSGMYLEDKRFGRGMYKYERPNLTVCTILLTKYSVFFPLKGIQVEMFMTEIGKMA